MPNERVTAVAMVCLVCLVGCAAKVKPAFEETTPGSGPPVARLAGSAHRMFFLFYNRTFFTSPVSVDSYHADDANTEWLLLPGPHAVHAIYGRQFLFMLGGAFFMMRRPALPFDISFTAEPGRKYRVDSELRETQPDVQELCSWIVDDDSGKVLEGVSQCKTVSSPPPTQTPSSNVPTDHDSN